MKMKKTLAFSILLLVLMIFPMALSVQASPGRQTSYATPTAGPDGRIIYIVQELLYMTSLILICQSCIVQECFHLPKGLRKQMTI